MNKADQEEGYVPRIKFIKPDDGHHITITTKLDNKRNPYREIRMFLFDGFFSDAICEFADTLYQVEEKDVVYLHIDSPGGSVANMNVLLLAMEHCKAKIHGIVERQASSCGAFTAANCDTLTCSDTAEVMFHSMASCVFGKLVSISEKVEILKIWNRTISEPAITKGLLTEKEYDSMMDHKRDIFLCGEDLQIRCGG